MPPESGPTVSVSDFFPVAREVLAEHLPHENPTGETPLLCSCEAPLDEEAVPYHQHLVLRRHGGCLIPTALLSRIVRTFQELLSLWGTDASPMPGGGELVRGTVGMLRDLLGTFGENHLSPPGRVTYGPLPTIPDGIQSLREALDEHRIQELYIQEDPSGRRSGEHPDDFIVVCSCGKELTSQCHNEHLQGFLLDKGAALVSQDFLGSLIGVTQWLTQEWVAIYPPDRTRVDRHIRLAELAVTYSGILAQRGSFRV